MFFFNIYLNEEKFFFRIILNKNLVCIFKNISFA